MQTHFPFQRDTFSKSLSYLKNFLEYKFSHDDLSTILYIAERCRFATLQEPIVGGKFLATENGPKHERFLESNCVVIRCLSLEDLEDELGDVSEYLYDAIRAYDKYLSIYGTWSKFKEVFEQRRSAIEEIAGTNTDLIYKMFNDDLEPDHSLYKDVAWQAAWLKGENTPIDLLDMVEAQILYDPDYDYTSSRETILEKFPTGELFVGYSEQ